MTAVLEVPAAPDLPTLGGFAIHYGLQVSDVGEDGDVVILGHHGNAPMRIVAALNRHARQMWGYRTLLDDGEGYRLEDLGDCFTETYAVNMDWCGDPHHEAGCVKCFEISQSEWWLEWHVESGREGAFPVTVFHR